MSKLTERAPGVFTPSFYVVAQESKKIYLGEKCYGYDPHHYLLVTVELPITAYILEASPGRPYLSVRVDLGPGAGWIGKWRSSPSQNLCLRPRDPAGHCDRRTRRRLSRPSPTV